MSTRSRALGTLGGVVLASTMLTVAPSSAQKVNLAVMNMGAFAMQSEEAAHAVNDLLQSRAVIASHANEAATTAGKVNAGSKTKQFIDLVKNRAVHPPLSGKTMEFDGHATCLAGC